MPAAAGRCDRGPGRAGQNEGGGAGAGDQACAADTEDRQQQQACEHRFELRGRVSLDRGPGMTEQRDRAEDPDAHDAGAGVRGAPEQNSGEQLEGRERTERVRVGDARELDGQRTGQTAYGR